MGKSRLMVDFDQARCIRIACSWHRLSLGQRVDFCFWGHNKNRRSRSFLIVDSKCIGGSPNGLTGVVGWSALKSRTRVTGLETNRLFQTDPAADTNLPLRCRSRSRFPS